MNRTKDKKLINILIVAVVLVAVFVVFFNFISKSKREYIYITFLSTIDGSSTVVKSQGSYILTDDVEPINKDGYEFIGWFYDDDCKLEVSKGTVFNSSHTIKAGYSKVLTKTTDSLTSQIHSLEDSKYLTVKTNSGYPLTLTEIKLLSNLNPFYLDLSGAEIEGQEISYGMFNNYLEVLYLPSNVTKINDNAFNGYYVASQSSEDKISYYGSFALKEIYLNEGIQSIGNKAFYKSNILNLSLPNSVQKIGDYVFEESKIENLSIGKNLKDIGQGAFKDLTLKSLKLNSENANLRLENNILYTFDYKTIVFGANYNNKNLIINDNVEVVSNYAFCDNNSIISLTLPSSIKIVGDYSFYGLKNLTEIQFSDCVNYTIGKYAFANCSKIEKLNFGFGLNVIDNYAFKNNYSIKSIIFNMSTATDISQLEKINEGAFYNCTELVSFVTPSSVNHLGEKVFEGCENLQSVTLSPQIKEIKYKTFYLNHNLKSLSSNALIETISDYAFAECYNLESVDCLYNASSIGTASFRNCRSLKNAYFNNIKKLEQSVFEGCENLINTGFASLESISSKAFNDCKKLEQITLVPSIKLIECDSFENCDKLKTINMLNNSNYTCKNNIIYTKDLKQLIFYPLSLAETVFHIDENLEKIENKNVFLNSHISNFIVDEDNPYFASINGVLFNKDLSVLIKYPNNAEYTSIDFQTQVKTVSEYAFRNNQNLTKIIFPSSIETFEKGSLQCMEKIKEIELPFVGQSKKENCFIGFIFGADLFVSNIDYVPSTLKKVKVTEGLEVSEYSFYQAENIEIIEFNKEVQIVEKYAFYECLNLKNVIFNGKINKISEFSFYKTAYLQYITIGFSSELIIENKAFNKLEKNVTLTIHNNYQSVVRYLRQEYIKKFTNIYSRANSWTFAF